MYNGKCKASSLVLPLIFEIPSSDYRRCLSVVVVIIIINIIHSNRMPFSVGPWFDSLLTRKHVIWMVGWRRWCHMEHFPIPGEHCRWGTASVTVAEVLFTGSDAGDQRGVQPITSTGVSQSHLGTWTCCWCLEVVSRPQMAKTGSRINH